MRVAGDRVRSFDAGEMMPELRGEDGTAAPSGVAVKPQALLPAELPNLSRVDR